MTSGTGQASGRERAPGSGPVSWRALARCLRRAAVEVARLVLPVECAGCGALDEPLCAACRSLLAAPARRRELGAPRLDRMDGTASLPVWSPAVYTGAVRELVVAWKDGGRLDMSAPLRECLAVVVRSLAPVLLAAATSRAPLQVVAAPSSAASRRRRGADVVGELARAVADALCSSGVPARHAPVLRQRRGARDQAGLGSRARGRNLAGRVVVRRGAAVRGRVVLLVDDVMTTGATLAACERALQAGGAVVVGAVVLAATPAPGSEREARPAPVVRVHPARRG